MKFESKPNQYILLSDNEIISSISRYTYDIPINFKFINLANLETKEKYRGHGYAKKILSYVLKELSAKFPAYGFYLLVREDSNIAKKLYLKFGFKLLRKIKSKKNNRFDLMVLKNKSTDSEQLRKLITTNFNTDE